MSFILADQIGQIVRDRHVQFVDRTTAEIRARVGQSFELVDRVQVEKVPVHVGIRQIVPGDVGQRAQTLVDVIVLRVVDYVVADGLPVAEERFVVVVCGQVTVHHFCMISHPHLY